MAFNLEAFEGLLRNHLLIHGQTDSTFAKSAGVSPGALADIKNRDPDTGRPRRQPSTQMVGKLARALDVPVGALVSPEPAEVKAS